jgi:thioredoxin reductase (NADPH)
VHAGCATSEREIEKVSSASLNTEILIIGGGPAALTAAIYASRANLTPIVLEGSAPNLPGGQLMITTDVENFPGFPTGISGPELMLAMREQAVNAGAIILTENAVNVDFSSNPLITTSSEGVKLSARAVIVATGASAKWLGLPEETSLYGKGISACATCDGFFFRGKHVIVIGGGDTAMEEASYLARLASKVTHIHRRDRFRASAAMQKRVLENEKIEVVWNSTVEKLMGADEGKFHGAVITNRVTGDSFEIAADGLFVAIGHKPNTEIFEGQLELDENGYILTKPGSPLTSRTGVFAAGDIQDTLYKQAITAAASGCKAAIQAIRYLEEQD